MKLTFDNLSAALSDLTYAYSYRFEETPLFSQKENCIENSKNPEATYGYDNISLLTKKSFHTPVTIRTRCAFEDLGAPLIVIADKLETDERGIQRYGNYLEVVLWKNGINVWRMFCENKTVTWKQLMGVDFSVSENDVHTLCVSIDANTLHIQADDRKMQLYIEDIYPSYYLGINACEGINRFYDLEIF